MSNKDRDHTKCRKLGTSDLCVCCPCGCDTPMDAPNYYEELHGAPTEQKEEWEEEFDILSDTQIFTIDGKKGTLKNIYIYESLISFIRTEIAIAEERGRREGESEGAKRMTAKVRGVLMLYPQEAQDELSIVLKDYLDELSTLTQKL